jgi:hypothetical protein
VENWGLLWGFHHLASEWYQMNWKCSKTWFDKFLTTDLNMKIACLKMNSRNWDENQRSWKESRYVLNLWRKWNVQIFFLTLWSPTTKLGFIIISHQQSINLCSWQTQSLWE